MWTRRLASLDDTKRLAGALAGVVRHGDLILLHGGIGSGKTTFVQAVAAALGVTEPVTSPTFVIHNLYESGRLALNHFDIYRLEDRGSIAELGIEDHVDDGVTLVEWADRSDAFGPPYLTIAFALGAADDERIATIVPTEGSWHDRLSGLRELS